jgi:ABC-type uncharacterized transport system involved in gliding motility auxiliary subunit
MVMKRKYSLLILTVNIILYLVVIALWVSIPDAVTLNLSATIFNLVLTGVLLFLNQAAFVSFYQSNQFKKFTETLIFLFLVFSLLGLLNYWSFKHPVQTDLSLFKINSLTDQTKVVLKKIPGKLKFKIFARKQESFAWYQLAEMYRFEKNDIEIEKIDIDVRPDLVLEYNITNDATLVVEYNNKRQYVSDRDELNITNGIIKITRAADPVAYFVTGMGEASTTSEEKEGLKYIYQAMVNSAIDLRSMNLKTAMEVPFDAKLLIIWGIRDQVTPSQIGVIERFLNRGGRLLIGLDPDLNTNANKEFRNLLLKYHINLRNDLVMDKKNFVNGSNGTIPLIDQFNSEHPITSKFKGQVFFPLVSSVEEYEPNTKNADAKVSFLTTSSTFPDSWGETDLKEIAAGKASYTPAHDLAGPLSVGAAYEDQKNKIVVFGNSTFIINAYMKYGSNYNLYLNSVSWLIDEDRLISFNLPIIQSERIFISGPQFGIIFYFSVLFSPLVLIGAAFFMYRRRRVK